MGGGKTGLKIFVTIAVLLGVVWATYFKLEEFSAEKVRQFTDRYSQVVRVEFDRALINPFDRSLHVWGVHCEFSMGSSCSAAKVVVDKFDHENTIPRFFKGAAEGVSVPVDFMNFGTLARDFRKMGYDELNFDLSADYIYEDKARRLSVRKLSFEGPDSCQVSAGFVFGDIKLQRPGISGLIGVSVLDGGLVWQDRSLADRVLKLYADGENVELSVYREKVLNELQLKMQTAGSIGNGYAENFYAEMKKFIKNPGELVFRVEPSEPVPLLYMFMGRNFEDLLNLFGVTVDAENS